MILKRSKFLSVLLSFSIIFSCFCFRKNKVECDNLINFESNVLAIGGVVAWPAFVVDVLTSIIPILLPAAKGVEFYKELNEESTIVQKIVELVTGKIAQAAQGDIIGLCWTVIDIIVTFLPGGNTFKVGKLALVVPKLAAQL